MRPLFLSETAGCSTPIVGGLVAGPFWVENTHACSSVWFSAWCTHLLLPAFPTFFPLIVSMATVAGQSYHIGMCVQQAPIKRVRYILPFQVAGVTPPNRQFMALLQTVALVLWNRR